MCCEPAGSNLPAVGECPTCGMDIDKDGDSLEICGHSPHYSECPDCGSNPCDQMC